MSAENQPPSYNDHSNFQTQPPQNFQQYPQTYPQPQVVTVPPNTFHTVPQFTVVTQQPTAGVVVGVTPLLGPLPIVMSCPYCYAIVTTSVKNEISLRTHCCALGLCLVGLWPCAIMPYCCGGCCQKTVHTCPNCNTFIGSD
ncbi:hypothetical protein ACKWTF_001933 [Chironomus riparius]